MLLLNREDILKAFTMREAIEADKKAFLMNQAGKIDSPLRTVIHEKNGGTFLFMPAYSAEEQTAVLKNINIFPQNIEQKLMTSPAQILLIDGNNGYVQALMDGATVTQMRTGASTGAAFDLLAKRICRTGALIGTGGQAEAQLEAMLEVRELQEVRVFDLNAERCSQFCMAMQKKFQKVNIVSVSSSEECVEDADIIITVTPSSVPVFDGMKIKNGATVSCVGTYEPDKHELDPALLPRTSKIICDDKEAALAETGDLLIPLSQGIIQENEIQGNLADVISGRIPGRENDEEIIVYETVGIAAMDLIAAKKIYENAVRKEIGLNWK